MDKKEVIVVFVLALLVLLAATARLFSTPVPASGSQTRPGPLRGIAPLPGNRDPGDRRSVIPLWPTLARNLWPEDPAAAQLLHAAETIASEGLFDGAIAAYRRFIERFPRGHAAEFALLRVSQCYTLARRYRDAMASYELFLTRHAGSGYRPLALLWCADAEVRLGYREPARKRLEEILSRHPMSDFAEGAKTLLDALNSSPPASPKREPEAPTS